MTKFDPYRIGTPQPIAKKLRNLSQVVVSAIPMSLLNLVQIDPREASAQMGEI